MALIRRMAPLLSDMPVREASVFLFLIFPHVAADLQQLCTYLAEAEGLKACFLVPSFLFRACAVVWVQK